MGRMAKMVRSPFDVLGVSLTCEPEVMDAAYRALMKKYHPDRWVGPADEAQERAQSINAAYAVIKEGRTWASPSPDEVEQEQQPSASSLTIVVPPPVPIARNLGWSVAISVAILGMCAAISMR